MTRDLVAPRCLRNMSVSGGEAVLVPGEYGTSVVWHQAPPNPKGDR